MRRLFHQVPVLDTGARGATNSFAQRGLGDVLLAWENEAWLARKEFGADGFEIVCPSLSILAEPPVAVVEAWWTRGHARGGRSVSAVSLHREGQDIVAANYYRPRDSAVAQAYAERYPR